MARDPAWRSVPPPGRRIGRHSGIVAVIAIGALLAVPPVSADRGVSISLGAIEIDEPLRAGMTYRLPDLAVGNPADERGEYRMGVGAIAGEGAVDPAWVSFDPTAFSLAPRGSQLVRVELHVPVGTPAGRYASLLRAEVAAPGGTGGALGAAAAARLTFRVADSALAEDVVTALMSFVARHLPWSLLLPSIVGLVVLARLAGSRYRLRVERRPPAP